MSVTMQRCDEGYMVSWGSRCSIRPDLGAALYLVRLLTEGRFDGIAK